ncbi:unnamed protein product [Pedinophyceae sp. YPF-701]|nr:unnamed protein product [Pedinophyceae sp. YPF-701]
MPAAKFASGSLVARAGHQARSATSARAPVPAILQLAPAQTAQMSFSPSAIRAQRAGVACRAEGANPAALAASQGTPVPKTSMLVIGGTGTLGRQIVRQALDQGYDVRVIVRPRENPADFVRDWGATTVQADLTDPASIPAAMVGVHTVIDAATARPEESISKVDWEGKKALIQTAQALGIKRYIFFSIDGCDKHPEVPLMSVKACTEEFLADSGLPYTTLRLCGFMQAIIGNYAVPILEDRTVWGTKDQTRTAYLDTQDIARMTLAAINRPETIGKTLTLAGPKSYTIEEVITLCEELSDSEAQVTKVPLGVLKFTRALLSKFQWATDAADRLAFADVLQDEADLSAQMDETYKMLDIDPASITTLEDYLGQYFNKIMKRLKEVGAQSRQTDFYV